MTQEGKSWSIKLSDKIKKSQVYLTTKKSKHDHKIVCISSWMSNIILGEPVAKKTLEHVTGYEAYNNKNWHKTLIFSLKLLTFMLQQAKHYGK